MCEKKTRASYWKEPVKINASAMEKLGVDKPVFAIVYGEDGTVGIFYRGIECEKEVVKCIDANDVWKRVQYLSGWKDKYKAFKIPPQASDESAFFVAACDLLEGHDVPLGPLTFPPK